MENKLLSKVIDEQNLSHLYRGNVTEDDFYTQKDAYQFIMKYVKTYDVTPPMETVTAECPAFVYEAEIHDHIDYLIKSVKNATAKRKAFELLQKEAGKRFQSMNGTDFVTWLADESAKMKAMVETDSGLGTNFASNGKERKESYIERKENRSGRFIPTPYPSITQWLGGGFELGDYVLLNAYTNRGKSWLASQIGVVAWNAGFGVLHYSPELSKSQQLDRLDTLNGHFNNTALKAGELADEKTYFNYLDRFKAGDDSTPYMVKSMDDLANGLSLEVIEADIQANPNIKMIILDGFNLIAHKGKGGSNRDAMSNTSRQLRQLFGKYGVVGLVVAQTPTSAEKENKEDDEAGARMVKPPELHQYSETVAVVQDACCVLTFDQFQGIGKIKLAKARTPHVGKDIEVHCDFNQGFIRETEAIDYF